MLWGAAAAGVVLIGVALALVLMGMKQGHEPAVEREPRRSGARKHAEAEDRSNDADRKPKAKRKE